MHYTMAKYQAKAFMLGVTISPLADKRLISCILKILYHINPSLGTVPIL